MERRSPTGIARERETCADDAGPGQRESRTTSSCGRGERADPIRWVSPGGRRAAGRRHPADSSATNGAGRSEDRVRPETLQELSPGQDPKSISRPSWSGLVADDNRMPGSVFLGVSAETPQVSGLNAGLSLDLDSHSRRPGRARSRTPGPSSCARSGSGSPAPDSCGTRAVPSARSARELGQSPARWWLPAGGGSRTPRAPHRTDRTSVSGSGSHASAGERTAPRRPPRSPPRRSKNDPPAANRSTQRSGRSSRTVLESTPQSRAMLLKLMSSPCENASASKKP